MMAIDMCSESWSLGTSPRISFSHDLRHTQTEDSVPTQHYQYRSDSDSDFNFCVGVSIDSEPCSADELFSHGLIRPLQIQQRLVRSKQQISVSKPQSVSSLPLPLHSSKPQCKSFWRFKRSSSLHCDNASKKSSIWSLPLLSRSNSTGSVLNSKRTLSTSSSSSKDVCQKHNSQKQPKSSSSSSFYVYPKPPLKKNYGNGVRINPVLNVPPPACISKGTANLFGLGSLFRSNGKDKKNKK